MTMRANEPAIATGRIKDELVDDFEELAFGEEFSVGAVREGVAKTTTVEVESADKDNVVAGNVAETAEKPDAEGSMIADGLIPDASGVRSVSRLRHIKVESFQQKTCKMKEERKTYVYMIASRKTVDETSPATPLRISSACVEWTIVVFVYTRTPYVIP